jgi:hypothetical protein
VSVLQKTIDLALRRHALKKQYQLTFETPAGQAVLRHIAKLGHLFASTYVAGDSHESARREGERRMVLNIVKAVYGEEIDIEKITRDILNEDTP